MKRWITPIALFILLSVLPLWASATEGSTTGTCGDNATWSYDAQSATLTISGQGAIRDNAQDEFTHLHGVIRTVVIEDGITSIGTNALHNLTWAYEIVIPPSVKYIGHHGLPAASNATNDGLLIHIESLKDWCDMEFEERYCGSVTRFAINGDVYTTFYIPDGVTKIPKWAFSYNKALWGVTIPDSVTEIEDYAFFACNNLGALQMGNGVTRLGKGAFRSCFELKEVTISSKLTYVGDEAFSGCKKMKISSLPDTVTYIGTKAFHFCHGILEFRWPAGVTNIPDEVFCESKLLKKLYIPSTVTSVGNKVLWNNTSNWCDVVFEGSPPDIGDSAFEGFKGTVIYSGGKGWTVSHMLNYGGTVTWQRDPNSPDDNPPDTQPTDPSGMSWRVENDTLYISGSGYMDFGGDTVPWAEHRDTIKAVEISEGILNVGISAFRQFTALECVKLPDGLLRIDHNAFMECTKLTQINLPESLKVINEGAFRFCISLPEIHLPDGLELLGAYAFRGCGQLQSIAIPAGLDGISQGAFMSCVGLTSIVLPENIAYIGECAFEECSSLKMVEMQGPVANIYRRAFYGCSSLEKLVIPASVWHIGDELLGGAFGLKEIHFEGDMPKLGENLFPHGMSTYTLYYPKGNLTWDQAYLAAVVQQYNPRLTVVAVGMASNQPPVTEPPVTEPPVTEPPVTEPPVTDPTVTDPPATEPTVTDPLVTEPSATMPPTEPVDIQPTEPKAPIWPYIFGGASVVIVLAILAWIWIKRWGKKQ